MNILTWKEVLSLIKEDPRVFVDAVVIPDDGGVRCYNKTLRIFG